MHDPIVLSDVLERWTASITTGQPFDMIFPLRGVDGVYRSFLTRVLPLKDSTGQVQRWFGTNTDISALKQSEEALRESEERFKKLYNESPIPTFTWQKKGGDFILVDFNRAAIQLTKEKVGEFLGTSAMELYKDRPQIISDMNLCYKEQSVVKREITSQHFAPGRFLSVHYGFIPQDLIIVHMEDRTEFKRIEPSLK